MTTQDIAFTKWICRFLCFGTCLAWTQFSMAAQEDLSAEAKTTETQSAAAAPRKVYVSVAFNTISDIKEVDQTFYADFYLRLRWADDTYSNYSTNKKKERLHAPPEWRPVPDFTNAQDSVSRYQQTIYEVLAPGIVQSLNRYSGTFRMNVDLTYFPFDKQKLYISLEDENMKVDELEFVHEAPNTLEFKELREAEGTYRLDDFLEEKLRLPEWNVEKISTSTEKHFYKLVFDSGEFSQFFVIITLERHWTYYVSKIIGVAILILCLAVPSFFLSPTDLSSRAAFILRLFLAIVAHNYVVSTMLPKVPYLTALDYILIGSQLLLCLAALEHLCVYRIAMEGGHESTVEGILRARKIDRFFIHAFPAVVIIFPLTVWILSTF